MKYSTIFFSVFCFLILSACAETPKRPEPILPANYEPVPVQTVPNSAATITTPTATPQPEPAQNAAGMWHYTCANGCEGGAGQAIYCPKCGETLVHNAAYHQ